MQFVLENKTKNIFVSFCDVTSLLIPKSDNTRKEKDRTISYMTTENTS